MDAGQFDRVTSGRGFFAALDQSGGSTPKALAAYGVDADRWDTEAQMFDLVHAMRTRVVTDPAFAGDRVLAAILFEQTMDREVEGLPTGRYLWEQRGVVPFLKVDQGLAEEAGGVQLMKPLDGLDELLERAVAHGMFGTKMRSVIADAEPAGIAAAVEQQFEVGRQIAAAGLVPVLEPEVSITSPHKGEAERLLRDAIARHLADVPADTKLMLKLTIPDVPGLYADVAADPRVLRLLALSGGYGRDEACTRLAAEPTMIASFSRALLDGLTDQQTDEQFHAELDASVGQIYTASVTKTV